MDQSSSKHAVQLLIMHVYAGLHSTVNRNNNYLSTQKVLRLLREMGFLLKGRKNFPPGIIIFPTWDFSP